MQLRKATHLALTLLFAAGLGVPAASTRAQTTSQKKTSPARSRSTAHRKRAPKKTEPVGEGAKSPYSRPHF